MGHPVNVTTGSHHIQPWSEKLIAHLILDLKESPSFYRDHNSLIIFLTHNFNTTVKFLSSQDSDNVFSARSCFLIGNGKCKPLSDWSGLQLSTVSEFCTLWVLPWTGNAVCNSQELMIGHKLNFCTIYSITQMHYFVKRVANFEPLYLRHFLVKIQSFCAH